MAEPKLRDYLDASPDGILILGAACRILHVNTGIERLFGYRREELSGQPLDFLIPEGFRLVDSVVDSWDAPTGSADSEASLNLIGCRKDGSEIPVEVRFGPVGHGELDFVVGVVREISGRGRAEEERELFFRFSIDMLCIAGLDGYFKRLNPAWERVPRLPDRGIAGGAIPPLRSPG